MRLWRGKHTGSPGFQGAFDSSSPAPESDTERSMAAGHRTSLFVICRCRRREPVVSATWSCLIVAEEQEKPWKRGCQLKFRGANCFLGTPRTYCIFLLWGNDFNLSSPAWRHFIHELCMKSSPRRLQQNVAVRAMQDFCVNYELYPKTC